MKETYVKWGFPHVEAAKVDGGFVAQYLFCGIYYGVIARDCLVKLVYLCCQKSLGIFSFHASEIIDSCVLSPDNMLSTGTTCPLNLATFQTIFMLRNVYQLAKYPRYNILGINHQFSVTIVRLLFNQSKQKIVQLYRFSPEQATIMRN